MADAQLRQGGMGIGGGGDVHAVRHIRAKHCFIGTEGAGKLLFLRKGLRPGHRFAGHGRYAAAVHQADRVTELPGNRPGAHDGKAEWCHGIHPPCGILYRQKGQGTVKVLPSSRGRAPPVSSVRDAAHSISRLACWRRLKALSPYTSSPSSGCPRAARWARI